MILKTLIPAAALVAMAMPAIAQDMPTDEARFAAFTKCDKNTDKKLDMEEYKCVLTELGQEPALAEQLFGFRDSNSDSFISEEEYKAPLTL